MEGFTRKHLTGPLAEAADRLAKFLEARGLDFERFAAHLRLDILSPREAWALRRFATISGGDTTPLIRDLQHRMMTANLQTIVPQTATASVTGTAVDMVDTDGPVHGLVCVGAASGTSPTLDVRFQSCATVAGTYADIGVPGSVFPTITAGSKTLRTDFKRPARFVRAVATIAGTTPSFALTVVVEAERSNSTM